MRKSCVTALLATILLSGCGSSGLGIGPSYNGDGNIVLADSASNAVVTSTQAAPYMVKNTFTLNAAEGKYANGTFNATIVSYTNGCFTVVPITTLPSPAFSFQANPTATNNPCLKDTLVQAVISDTKGHSTTVWFKLINDVILAS